MYAAAARLLAALSPRFVMPRSFAALLMPGGISLATPSLRLALAAATAASTALCLGVDTMSDVLLRVYQLTERPDDASTMIKAAVPLLHGGHQNVHRSVLKMCTMAGVRALCGAGGALEVAQDAARHLATLHTSGATHTAVDSVYNVVMEGGRLRLMHVVRHATVRVGGVLLHPEALPAAKALAASMVWQRHGARAKRGAFTADELAPQMDRIDKRLTKTGGFRTLDVVALLVAMPAAAVASVPVEEAVLRERLIAFGEAAHRCFRDSAVDAEHKLKVHAHKQGAFVMAIIHSTGALIHCFRLTLHH